MRKIFTILFISSVLLATTYHTISIDGANDFAGDENVAGTSSSNWYFTWDNSNLYVGLDAADVNSNDGNKWVILYIDTDPQSTPTNGTGTTTGIGYNTQQPTLPFTANYHFRWKADNSYSSLEKYTTTWGNTTWTGGVSQSGTFIELSIPLSEIGLPTNINICGAMINETAFNEYTFFMTPNGQTEGYDANFTKWFGYPLTSSISPNSSTYVDFALPVELNSFKANILSNSVQLRWQTATEVNNYGFKVERSIDNPNNFETLTFVEGHGNSNSVKSYSYTDNKVADGKYYYRLKQINSDGTFEYSETISAVVGIAETYNLLQNYPNPFNPTTTIQFNLPENSVVSLKVFNALGQQVADLANGLFEAGNHKISFNASELNSGIYFYQIKTNDFTQVRKMMLVK